VKKKPKKSLGQNFLIDKNVIKKIVNLGELTENDHVLEVGPGTGNLTHEIFERKPNKIFLVEKDNLLSSQLQNQYKDTTTKIFNTDILNFDESKISEKKIIIFGNLPYNISTQILVKWITNELSFKSYKKLILMFQKEVAERIIAKSNQKEYGRLSVISNWRLNIRKNFDVPKECFFPKPNVESSVISFTPKKDYINFKNPKNLEHVTRIFFLNKRKMINKAYKKLFKNNLKIAKKLDLDLKFRPGNLSCENYYSLTNFYEELIN
tara:strand:+ start:134 stop:928 length:795 start_codon:yes stop_codon:yes gene_type:complete